MEKKTKKAVKKASPKKDVKPVKRTIKKSAKKDSLEIADIQDNEIFEEDFEFDTPARSIYIKISWTFFKEYIKSFFRK